MDNVALVTSTFTTDPRTDHRFLLAQMMCTTAVTYGYKIIVVESSPDPEAARMLREVGADVYTAEDAKMGPARRQALKIGLDMGFDIIAWLEPEKVGMIPCFEPCLKMMKEGYDIIIPWRNRLFADYPHYQALSEATANFEMEKMTGMTLDLMCGPRIMTRETATLFLSYEGRSRIDPSITYNDQWGILFVPVLWALSDDGFKVGSCPVDYIHPAVQTKFERYNAAMDKKRDIQRTELVDAMRQEHDLLVANRH